MTSTPLSFVTLGPDDYDRAKKVLNKAKHPGFIGREFMYRCATKGVVVLAQLGDTDVGVVMVDHKHTLQTLSVVESAQGHGVGSALVREVRARAAWVKAIASRISLFERLGYRCVGAPEVGASGKMSTQLLQRVDGAPAAALNDQSEHPRMESGEDGRRGHDEASPFVSSGRFARLGLLEFVHALSPELRPPYHLSEWCAIIEASHTQDGIRALCDVPIRHYKTETTLHGIVWMLVRDPTREIIFLTHTLEAAQARGKRLRQLAEAAGVGPAKGTNTITHWQNEKGGGVVVMSAAQSKIGYNCHALIVDDPIDEDAADDPNIREVVDKSIAHYTARCMRRGRPGPVLILMSRWHPDDPIGRRLSRGGWDYVHHPAIVDEGKSTERAFAPEVWPLDELRKMRAELKLADPGERIWFAQLMGDPQPEGSNLFGAPTRYDSFPSGGYRVAYGVDFAYTDAPGSDWFAAVVARIYGHKVYLLDVRRSKLDAVQLEDTCRALQSEHGRAPLWSYQAGPEIGLSRLLLQRGIPVGIMPARYNKLVRAQKTIRRWNEGDVLVPANAPWAPGFLHRVALFRGHERDRDDEIDAMVSMCDAVLGGGSAAPQIGLGGRGGKVYQGMLG